ncbi:uracil-xanthine permease family protein [Maledivibacter halophilus]|uniref:Nucleobase:cation symporter-2, NCS2 family n=1 Tax=Maledivibacter halophilus TaxID=36842 RepID=A0A1T5M9X5_9FIRM|nr:nucleobase:cation symporter-2 family protein [Maledivibacter halophilus]SKC84794.1 nucleobase:cation symporter-2, NCS2 family [Maledivibacter halophilus]
MKNNASVYELDGRPELKIALPLGLQHVLAMFTGNLAPIIIIANVVGLTEAEKIYMIQCAMVVAGIVTMIQLYPVGRIGARLPLVMGTSFAFVPTAIAVGHAYGLSGVLGASLLGSFVEIIMGIFIKPLRKFFPPLVIGSVLMAIGLSLLPVGIEYFAGGAGAEDFGSLDNMFLGFLVLFIIILLQRFAKGIFSISAILVGIVVGYLVAIPMGKVEFSSVAAASWISIPMPMKFGMDFHLDAVLKFSAIYLVAGLESMGNISGITIAGLDREATEDELSGAVIADGAGSLFAAIFNVLPNTAFGQNAGIVAMTKVVNRYCVATGAVFLILAGIIPKIGAVVSVMPTSVLGGAVITVFAMITINGIKMISRAGFNSRNNIILAIAFSLGLGLSQVPEAMENMPYLFKEIFSDSVVGVGVLALIFNIVFPENKEEVDEISKVQN